MKLLETMEVKRGKDKIIINVDDFNPDIHEKIERKARKIAKKKNADNSTT